MDMTFSCLTTDTISLSIRNTYHLAQCSMVVNRLLLFIHIRKLKRTFAIISFRLMYYSFK